MRLEIKKNLAESLGMQELEPFGIEEGSFNYRGVVSIDLTDLGSDRLQQLRELCDRSDAWGSGRLVRDIDKWVKVCSGDSSVKPSSCSQFADLLIRMLLDVSGQRIYERLEDGTMLAYYVNKVVYHPPQTSHDYSHPAFTELRLVYKEFGNLQEKTVSFYAEHCQGMSPWESLARQNYFPEEEQNRTDYLEQHRVFLDESPQVGKQFWVDGVCTDDCDGNPNESSWFGRRSNRLNMVRNGEKTRCVVDVFFEEEQGRRGSRRNEVHVDHHFWSNRRKKATAPSAGQVATDRFEEYDNDEVQFEDCEFEVPTHPYLAVFDMSKHLRLRAHITQLEEYVYDRNLADKLVVPDDLRQLVGLLIEHRDGAFQDIVRGKSGGAVVLLAGPPGVGKTLTAEVFSEAEARPLYSVQCSQLGTDATELEDELMQVFTRAHRWNAIILLDEADVYVRERGDDLAQNAIVGVFLRVLEYQSSIMFMTTNRPDSVDDAIASRCIARLIYQMPTPEQQEQIWKILADNAGAKISAKSIKAIVRDESYSGRDIKTLIKLAMLTNPDEPITLSTVQFVRKFRPSMETT